MTHRDPHGVSTSDRRRGKRSATEAKVHVQIDTQSLDGTASNLSNTGILFFTDEEVKVTIEVKDATGTHQYRGNLVRCERIKGNHRGWAVEFDRG
ncbi:MAG: PilZ domain-containing protein [Planctomycetes bacterium]|nr:PilZ domain-containing protein [Planctomycetota bacterium]